jgi:hypothetical protein
MEKIDPDHSQGVLFVANTTRPSERQVDRKNFMYKSVQLISLLCIGFFVGSVQAAPVKMLGFDDMTCAAWFNSKNDGEQRASYLVWMRGVLTGHNYGQQKQQVSSVSSGTIEMFVDRYCKSNPKEDFSEAVFRLSDQFSGRNQPITK